MHKFKMIRLTTALAAGLALAVAPSMAGASVGPTDWQTGIRAVGGGATIEPAVNDTNGLQTFLITPNHSPFYAGPAPVPSPFYRVSAPLYLVTYPLGSTADSLLYPFNCYTGGFFHYSHVAYNCDHAQIPGIKGHDHLVGVPGSKSAGGDYNVQWHVLVTFFTGQGISDGASNIRITTLSQLQTAQNAGDVSRSIDTGIYFNCSVVSGAVYAGATPMTFPPLS
jgi:hypothetical protein